MGNKLVVRMFNVELGDCIYVRIPNGNEDFHVLIDCGTKGPKALVENAVKSLEELLPAGSGAGKKRLDLLVVTHKHADHIKGFDPEYFQNIEIKNIWLSALMDPNHPQAEKALALDGRVKGLIDEVVESGLELSPEMEMLAELFINNQGAEEALTDIFPRLNNITPQYVVAGKTQANYGIQLEEATIRILGPEKDIDGYYLGEDFDESLNQALSFENELKDNNANGSDNIPKNISLQDFRVLQNRMLPDAFAFADVSSRVTNNSSVVLLIEWKERRLLFVGDAEWHGEYKAGKQNGAWNVMWKRRKQHLNQPMDFLKIGHHGSYNSTPWDEEEDDDYEVNQILNAILPKPAAGEVPKARAVVSTERSTYKTIPKADLLVELGRRVSNTRNYLEEFESKNIDIEEEVQKVEHERAFLGSAQPYRTDFEKLLNDKDFIELEFD